MTAPCAGVSKILLDWTEKASVLVVASLAVSPYCEGFQFFAYFKNSEFPLIMHVSESGPEVLVQVGFEDVGSPQSGLAHFRRTTR